MVEITKKKDALKDQRTLQTSDSAEVKLSEADLESFWYERQQKETLAVGQMKTNPNNFQCQI